MLLTGYKVYVASYCEVKFRIYLAVHICGYELYTYECDIVTIGNHESTIFFFEYILTSAHKCYNTVIYSICHLNVKRIIGN